MKRACVVSLFLCLTTSLFSQSSSVSLIHQSAKIASPITTSQANPKAEDRIFGTYGKLPLSFEANQGQTDAQVKFLSRTGSYSLFLTRDEAMFALSGKKPKSAALRRLTSSRVETRLAAFVGRGAGGVLRMKLRNVNPAVKVTGGEELAGKSNYFVGNDPAKWRSNVPTYAKVKYEGIYSGIDLVYYGNQRQLEYDFIVAPGADPRRIQFDVRGAKRIRQDAQGELAFKVGEAEIRWHKPNAYQEKNGTRQEIAAHYAITDTNRVGFEVAKYDASRPLYIDPLIYSTYLGGSATDYGASIAVDSAGNAYIIGHTGSTNFPTTNPLQPANAGSNDVFVAKVNPAGSALVYSTYLGGSSDDDGVGIAVDSTGNAYVTGFTASTDFPMMNPLQSNPSVNGYDAFVAKLDPTGSALVYSTYLGGSVDNGGSGIAVDSLGNAYVTGRTNSTDFPITPGAFQTNLGGAYDAFVTKINAAGSALVYSSYLGGSSDDNDYDYLDYGGGGGIAVDSTGNAYVVGQTYSTDFPTTPGAFQTVCDNSCYGGYAFVAKINPTGSALVYSTYLGGSEIYYGNGYGSGIAADSAGNAYVTGTTGSADFPTTPGAFQPYCQAGPIYCWYWPDAFVTKLNPTGSALVYSTYLGGSGIDHGYGIAVDSANNAYIIGLTFSQYKYPANFPTTPGALQSTCKPLLHSACAFVTKINPAGSSLVYSTYLGGSSFDEGRGIAIDSAGNAYVTGYTESVNFPTKNPLQAANAGGGDAFVAKIDVRAVPSITLSSSLNPSVYGQAVTFTAVLTSSIGAPPDGETVTFMQGMTVLGTGSLSGGSANFTTSALKVSTTPVKAEYGGDSNLLSGTKTLSQAVSKATTTTTLVSSLNPSNAGQSVTFTASVTPEFSGTVNGPVTFYDGTTLLKTVGVNGGVAKFTIKTLASGTHNITATYNGSNNFIPSSASLTQTVE